MKPTDQARADAAINSYKNRLQSEVDSTKRIYLDGKWHHIFGYANDPISGFHATAYQTVEKPHRIIIAYRGTDTALFTGETWAEKLDHALTTLQDIAVDATMVRDAVNPQKAAADAFTAQMLAKAAEQGIPKDDVTVAGHSLGGALAQIEAAKYGLAGSTYNAYGARALTDGTPQPGCHVTNYRMANDVVSAASPHVGSMVSLASHDDVQSLRAGRYLDAPVGAPPPNVLMATRWGDHGAAQHFGSQSPDNILAPQRFSEASQRYADHQSAFEHFTWDVSHERAELSQALRQMRAHPGQTHLPADIQRQVNEYLALNVDPSLRHAIEHSQRVQWTAHKLHDAGATARALGHAVRDMDERMASVAYRTGVAAFPLNPMAALTSLAVGESAHLHGRAADAAGHFVGDQFESAKHAVEQSAHYVAEAAQMVIHYPYVQAAATNIVVNQAVDLYHGAQSAARTVSRDIDAVERTAGQAYDTLTHPGQWFQHSAPAVSRHPASTHVNTSTTPPPAMDRRMGEHAPPAHVAAAPPKAVQAPPLTPSPEYLAASAAIQRVTAAIENGDRETLRKEGEAFTNSPHGQAIMAQARALVEREEQERARQQAQRPPRDPREAGHPDHALYQSIRTQVETLHTRNGICPSNKTLDHLTASVALHARENGWTRVDQVHFNADNSVIVAERKSDGFDAMPRFSSTHIQQAMQTPPEQAYQQMAAETQRQADVTQMVQQQMAQSRQGPSLGR